MTTRWTRLTIAGALLAGLALVGVRAACVAPPAAGGATTVSAPGGGRVTFTGTLDRTSVLRGGDGVVRMELVMRAAPDVEHVTAVRRPTDLVIVLDRSGSMTGEKIEHARAAVRELIGQLGPDDRFALVTYEHGGRRDPVQPRAAVSAPAGSRPSRRSPPPAARTSRADSTWAWTSSCRRGAPGVRRGRSSSPTGSRTRAIRRRRASSAAPAVRSAANTCCPPWGSVPTSTST
jgi:hypothetical protein